MANSYYVYEILVDDVPIYVGSSQDVDEKWPKSDPHRYRRLRAHGYFLEKFTAEKRLASGKFRTFKREILEAKANDKKLSFNILGDNLTSAEAAELEQQTVSKYGLRIKTRLPKVDKDGNISMDETYVGGSLINKINIPKSIPKNNRGNFIKAREESKKQNWWHNLSKDEKEIYKANIKNRVHEFMRRNPEKHKAIMEKLIAAGRGVTSKERRSESTRIKQSENMKKRWARNESWIPAKNALSAKCLRSIVSDPNMQKRKVQIIYNKMKDNGKDPNKWRESFLELVAMGICFNNGYRNWKNYFSSFEEIENFKYIKPAIK